MQPQVDVITLGVSDLDRTRRFYEEGLGLPVERERDDLVAFRLGSSALAVRPWGLLADEVGASAESHGFRGFTLSYIVEDADGVEAVLARAVEAGGELSKPTKRAFWGYSGYVTDPSGCPWKVASPKRRPLLRGKGSPSAAAPVPAATEITLTIGVADIKRAKEFYAGGIGWPVGKDYAKFVSFAAPDGTSDLAMYRWDALAKDADVPAEGDGFRGIIASSLVDSAAAVDAALDAAARAGGAIVRRPHDTPAGGRQGCYADLDGHLWRIATRI